jgi:hypothetical protein
MEATRARILRSARLLTLGASLLAGCGSATYTDMYFGTDAGAGFKQPEREAGLGADATAPGAADDDVTGAADDAATGAADDAAAGAADDAATGAADDAATGAADDAAAGAADGGVD